MNNNLTDFQFIPTLSSIRRYLNNTLCYSPAIPDIPKSWQQLMLSVSSSKRTNLEMK